MTTVEESVAPRQVPDPQPRARGPVQSLRLWRARGGLSAVLLALPAVLVFAVFAWFPIARGAVMSFQKTNFVQAASWVGWSNFDYVLHDPLVATAVRNTLIFTVLALVVGAPVPLLFAIFVSEVRRSRWVFGVLAYLPVVIPPVAAIFLWRTFYDPSHSGAFNSVLRLVGIGPQPWLNSTSGVLPSILLEAIWATAGATVVVYIAAMTGIRSDLYEAAELDGAGIFRRLVSVTLPQLRGVILVLLLLQIIGTMQLFTEPFLFTDGGPNNASLSILLLIYHYAFIQSDYGAATALSVLLALGLAVISVLYQLATRRWSD